MSKVLSKAINDKAPFGFDFREMLEDGDKVATITAVASKKMDGSASDLTISGEAVSPDGLFVDMLIDDGSESSYWVNVDVVTLLGFEYRVYGQLDVAENLEAK